MGNGTKEKPYIREDVLRLIKENGDKAEGLDLSWKYFEEGIGLYELDLKGIILISAHLEGAFLVDAHLEGANLDGAHLDNDTNLKDVDWGNYILRDERPSWFDTAADSYRQLKVWYTEHGLYDIAGKFFYREMEAKRKAQSWKKKPHLKLWSWVIRLLCGYGEKWERVVISALVIIFGLAIAYRFGGLSLPYSIYYSFVSFTALGYGSWVPQPTDWVKGLGVAEAVIGVFMMALFLVTFTRKMTR